MADTTTLAKAFTKPEIGSHPDTWGDILNTNFDLIDRSVGGVANITLAGDYTISATQAQNLVYEFAGILGAAATVTFPAFWGPVFVRNLTTGGFAINCVMGTGGASLAIAPNTNQLIVGDGVGFFGNTALVNKTGDTMTGPLVINATPTSLTTTGAIVAGGAITTPSLTVSGPITATSITTSGSTVLQSATGVTMPPSDNSTNLATTAYVKSQGYATTAQLGAYLPLAGGTSGGVTLSGGNISGGGSANFSGNVVGNNSVQSSGVYFQNNSGWFYTPQNFFSGGAVGVGGSTGIYWTNNGGWMYCPVGMWSANINTGGINNNGGGIQNTGSLNGVGAINSTGTLVVGGGGVIFYGEFDCQNVVPLADGAYGCGFPGKAWGFTESYVYYNASGRELKTDFAPLPDCLSLVGMINPSRYRWAKAADAVDDRVHWGFIAEDIESAMAAAGHEFGGHAVDDEGRHRLAYNELVPVLWRALQQLEERLVALEKGAP